MTWLPVALIVSAAFASIAAYYLATLAVDTDTQRDRLFRAVVFIYAAWVTAWVSAMATLPLSAVMFVYIPRATAWIVALAVMVP